MRREPDHPIGGPQTLPASDDKPGPAWDRAHMPAQAISLDASIGDPIAALKRVGGVRHNGRMRKIAITAAFVAAAVVVAVAAPGLVAKFGDALARALHADPAFVIGGIAFELASFAGYIALFWHV